MLYDFPKGARKAFQGELFSIWQWDQKMYDGSTKVFEGIDRSDYGTAIGVLPDGNILVALDTQPDRGPVLTSIGGRFEEDESPEEATRREFREETGYEAGRLLPFFTYNPSFKVRFTTHMFIARDLAKVGEPQLDAGEKIELKTYSFDDFLQLGKEDSQDLGGPIRDWMLRIKLLEASLDKSKRDTLYSLLYE